MNGLPEHYWLFLLSAPPTERRAKEGLDMLLAAAAFDRPVCVAFIGQGVRQLHTAAAPEQLAMAPLAKQLAALPLYGVEHIFADADGLSQITPCLSALEPLAESQLSQLIAGAQHVYSY